MTAWALVNTGDGVITNSGTTTTLAPNIPTGATSLTDEQYATVQAAAQDHMQCRLVNGVVRIVPLPTPALADLTQIKVAAAEQVDQAAEVARSAFLTPGSGQALEYQATKEDADRLLAMLAAADAEIALATAAAAAAVSGAAAARTTAPSAQPTGTEAATPPTPPTPPTPSTSSAPTTSTTVSTIPVRPVPQAADYPWLEAERLALLAIGVIKTLEEVALLVRATMNGWQVVGSLIKRIRRTAKLEIDAATTPEEVAAIVAAIVWPTP